MNLIKEYPYLKKLQVIAGKQKLSIHLVGGFLRDFVLNRSCCDFDFAVSNDAVTLAKDFADEIKGAFVLLDDDHGCARVVKKAKGTIMTYDFADFRAKTLIGDLTHRDFTINTLSLDILKLAAEDEVKDVLKDYKSGLKDARAKRIKLTSKNVFKEDALRILRAYSLRAQLNFTIEPQTRVQMKKDKVLLSDVSAERIREEMFKIFKSPQSCAVIKEMDRDGVLACVIPQIKVMASCKQGGYHHLDVWPHSIETLNQFEKIILNQLASLNGLTDLLKKEITLYLLEKIAGEHTRLDIVKWACLLHDIGKPDTKKKELGRLSFHGHEHVGRSIARHIANMLKFSTKERYMLEDLVLWHLRPGYLSNFKKPSDKAIYRYFRDTKEKGVSILLLSLADQRSTCGELTSEKDQKHHEKVCILLIKKYFEKKKEKPVVSLLTGHDIIKQLKIEPSPLIGKILKEISEQQALGKLKTKTEAVIYAKKLKIKDKD